MSAIPLFQVERGEVMIVRFNEAELFDTLLVSQLEDQLMELIERESPQKLLLDFSRVEFCSTSLINILLRIKKHVAAGQPGPLKLCCMKTSVRSAFEMLNLDGRVFEIHDTRESAVAAFQDQPGQD